MRVNVDDICSAQASCSSSGDTGDAGGESSGVMSCAMNSQGASADAYGGEDTSFYEVSGEYDGTSAAAVSLWYTRYEEALL